MNRRVQLWLGVSACALLGLAALPGPVIAQGHEGQGNAQDLDPDGGMRNECGEAGGCAEAGESIESRTADELGEDEDDDHALPTILPQPRSHGGGLSEGDSVHGGMNDGGLGD